MADAQLERLRRHRDRASVALQRNQRAYAIATGRMQEAAAAGLAATDPALPDDCRSWIQNAVTGLSSYELNLHPPRCTGHVHSPCGTLFDWAAKRDRAADARPALQRGATRHQRALDAYVDAHAGASVAAPPVVPADASDAEANAWIDHPEPTDDELTDLGSAPEPASAPAPTDEDQGGDEDGDDGGGGDEEDAGGGGDADDTPTATSDDRCGRPRVGHGHVGQACRVRLGEDRACQYHGAVA